MRQPVRNNETLKQIVLASEKRKMHGPLIQCISSALLTSLYLTPRIASLQWNLWVEKCVVVSYKTKKKAQNSIYCQVLPLTCCMTSLKKHCPAKLITTCETLWTFLFGLYLQNRIFHSYNDLLLKLSIFFASRNWFCFCELPGEAREGPDPPAAHGRWEIHPSPGREPRQTCRSFPIISLDTPCCPSTLLLHTDFSNSIWSSQPGSSVPSLSPGLPVKLPLPAPRSAAIRVCSTLRMLTAQYSLGKNITAHKSLFEKIILLKFRTQKTMTTLGSLQTKSL